jgi:hypothetical protein
MSKAELIELRAALTQLAKTLETERACVLRIVAIVERSMDGAVKDADRVTITPRDSVTGVLHYTNAVD